MRKRGSRRALGIAGVAVIALTAAAVWRLMQVASTPTMPQHPAQTEQPEPVAPTAAEETRAQRIARERRRCALHVSALTADGDLVYDDAMRFAGARAEADGSGIRVPNIQLGNGQWVNALVTPEGCVLIRSLAAGVPAQGSP